MRRWECTNARTLLALDFGVLARRLGDVPTVLLAMVLLLGAATIPQTARATPISIPFVFLNGTPADATQINLNFDTLVLESNAQDQRISGLELTNITSVTAGSGLTGGGSIGAITVSIATSGVTSSHLAPNSVGSSEIATGAVGALEVLDGSLQDIDLATSTTGSGTATVETTIRRFYIDQVNGVSDGRIQVACNGESQGNEATIRVYHNGGLFDTYVCSGGGTRPWTYFSPRFSITSGEIVDVTYQLTSPGLFYWREVALESQHPEPISVSADDSTVDYLTTTCASVTGTISIVAPGPGTVIVNANAWLRVKHTVGVQDETIMVLSETSGGDCVDWQHTRLYSIPSGYPTTGGSEIQTIDVRRVFDVASAATVTYYLNARQALGFTSTTDNIWWVGLQATFIPD